MRISRVIIPVVVALIVGWIATSLPTFAQLGSSSPVASTVSVGTSSVQLLAANGARHGVTFYNQSANVISVGPGTAAVTASGGGTVNIAGSGGMLVITCGTGYPCGNAWQGIASGSASVLTIWEF
jgi:hypothetical protein